MIVSSKAQKNPLLPFLSRCLFGVLVLASFTSWGIEKSQLSESLYQSITGIKCKTNIPFDSRISCDKKLDSQDISEKLIFNDLAQNQIAANECLISQIGDLRANQEKRDLIIENITGKLDRFSQLLEEKKKINQLLLINNDRFGDKKIIAQLRKDQAKNNLALEIMYQSVWAGYRPETRDFIEKLITQKNRSKTGIESRSVDQIAKKQFGELLLELGPAAKITNTSLLKESSMNGNTRTFNLSDESKVALASSQTALEGFVKSHKQTQELKNELCKIEARYGRGRELYDMVSNAALGVGTFALTGGYAVAATRGVLYGQTARILTTATLALGGGTAVVNNYTHLCPQNPIKQINPKGACTELSLDTRSLGDSFENANCALNISLEALGFVQPEIKAGALIASAQKIPRSAAGSVQKNLILDSSKSAPPKNLFVGEGSTFIYKGSSRRVSPLVTKDADIHNYSEWLINPKYYENVDSTLFLANGAYTDHPDFRKMLSLSPQTHFEITDYVYAKDTVSQPLKNVNVRQMDNSAEFPFQSGSFQRVIMTNGLCECMGAFCSSTCGGVPNTMEGKVNFLRSVTRVLDLKKQNSEAILTGQTSESMMKEWIEAASQVGGENPQAKFIFEYDKMNRLVGIRIRPENFCVNCK